MTVEVDLVRRVRRSLRDRPARSYVQDNPLTGGATAITIPAGDFGKFPEAGIRLEFDKTAGSNEVAITTDQADSATSTVPVLRGQDGTTSDSHAINTPILIAPRFEYAELAETIDQIISTELWPYVWVVGETTLTPDVAIDAYPSPVADIDEVVAAYQFVNGERKPVTVAYIPPELSDNTDFPNGTVLLSPEALWDTSDLFIAFKSRPTLANLTTQLEHLVVMGTVAEVLMGEEAGLVAPDVSAVQRNLQEGSRARAGVVLWERFQQARIMHQIDLMSTEDSVVRRFAGRV